MKIRVESLGASLLAGLGVFALLAMHRGGTDPADDDRAGVARAVLDYCEAFHDRKPELLERSLHRDLVTFGYYQQDISEPGLQVTGGYDRLIQLVSMGSAAGHVGDNAPREVEVFDLLDRTAAARLIGARGTDYMRLAKYDGQWRIVQVLWQGSPENG